MIISMKKNVAIISGVTSFLGKSMAKYLLSKNFIVFGIVRPSSKSIDEIKKINGINIIKIDFDKVKNSDFNFDNDSETLKHIDLIKSSNLDITFLHFGWGNTLDRQNFMAQMLNVDYSMKMLEFAKTIDAKRFIFAGSQAELSESAYGMAKKKFADMATYSLKNSDMQFIHMRIFSVYGKADRETSLIKTLVKHCKTNNNIDLSSCNYYWNFIFIDDFVNIVYRLIKNNTKTGIYDIASLDTRLLKDYVNETVNVLGSNIKLNFGARPDSSEVFSLPNMTNTLNAIGEYKFVSFSEGIKTV